MKLAVLIASIITMITMFIQGFYVAFLGWFAATLAIALLISDDVPELPGDFDEPRLDKKDIKVPKQQEYFKYPKDD